MATAPIDFTGEATGTGQIPNTVIKAYDFLIDWNFRSQPNFRQLVTKRPVDIRTPGDTVRFSIFHDMTPVYTALDEYKDNNPAVLADATQVDVQVNIWGNWTMNTEKARLVSLANVDEYLAQSIANNQLDSFDNIVQSYFSGGNTVYTVNNTGAVSKLASGSTAGGPTGSPWAQSGVNGVLGNWLMTGKLLTVMVTKLRDGSVPWTDGDGLYKFVCHPDVAMDLRTDVGPAGWALPHQYGAQDEIWRGVTGVLNGAAVTENPRCWNALNGAGTPNQVYNSYMIGMHAVAEAVWQEPTFVAKPAFEDALDRFTKVGWKAYVGWNKYRQESLANCVTGSSMVS